MLVFRAADRAMTAVAVWSGPNPDKRAYESSYISLGPLVPNAMPLAVSTSVQIVLIARCQTPPCEIGLSVASKVVEKLGDDPATVTILDCCWLPPLPEHVSENVLGLVRAPVDSEPLVALAPDQAPEAVQPVALVDDQVSVALAPLAIVCGLTLSTTVGAAATVTI